MELQTSLALLHGASATDISPARDQFGREPFQHPALQSLNGLSDRAKAIVLEKHRMASLAERYGLDSVIRWKPKKVSRRILVWLRMERLSMIMQMTNLRASGLPIVATQALYAIVGAVALQRGGEVANGVVRERIFRPLGLQ